ncbi:MAG: dihydroorotase [Gammaproteobacteria bacterium]
MIRIAINGGRIVDPVNRVDRIGTVYIGDGKILSINEKPNGFLPEHVIDATGQIVCPGFVDLSARLREPGQTQKASIASETRAAAAAGITRLCIPPDTHPVIDTPAVVELIKEKGEQAGYTGLLPIAALTKNLNGDDLASMFALKQAGCIAVSNARQPISNLLILRRAMEYAATHDLLLFYRPQNPSLCNNGCAHEGAFATRYGLPGIPESAETVALTQCLELVKQTGCRVHFGQLSSARSVMLLQYAKAQNLSVSADVAMHQLHLTEDDMIPFDSTYHVNPPFRTRQDLEMLRQAVREGVIDAVCSDHQPHDIDAKLGAFPETEAGISALETLLPLMLKIVKEQALSLMQGIASISSKPARLLGTDSGTLTPGKSADICIFAPEMNWNADKNHWKSRGHNTPFWEQTLKGRVTHTFQTGKLIYRIDNHPEQTV